MPALLKLADPQPPPAPAAPTPAVPAGPMTAGDFRAVLDAGAEARNRAVRAEALDLVKKFVLGGAAVGAGARALSGFARPGVAPVKPRQARLTVGLPVAASGDEDEDEDAPPAKSAEEVPAPRGEAWRVSDLLRGRLATDPMGVPGALPGAMGGTVLAAAGGWLLVDRLARARTARRQEREVEAARRRFAAALGDETVAAGGADPDRAAGAKTAAALDRLYDTLFGGKTAAAPAGECCPACGARLERGEDGTCNRCQKPRPAPETDVGPAAKTAAGPAAKTAAGPAAPPPAPELPASNNWMGAGLGVYGAAALLLGGAAGVEAYARTRKKSEAEQLRKAIELHRRQRADADPLPVELVPVPVRRLAA